MDLKWDSDGDYKAIEDLEKQVEDLKSLSKDLIKGADKCSQAPLYIVQPFLEIFIKHHKIMNKLDLTAEERGGD